MLLSIRAPPIGDPQDPDWTSPGLPGTPPGPLGSPPEPQFGLYTDPGNF